MKKPTPGNKRIGLTKPNTARASTAAAARSTSAELAGRVRTGTKIAKVVSLLRAPKGATITMLQKATGWQAHSVRGAIAGTIKKKLGLSVASYKTGDIRTYRIVS